jgi:PLP dependent protein
VSAPAADLVSRVRHGLGQVRGRIASAGRDPDEVTVVAVTKGFGPDAVEAALRAGLADIGENYAQELLAKWPRVDRPPGVQTRVHFIGRLQRNKIRLLAGLVDLYQSVDRPALVSELGRRHPGAAILVQVDVSGEPHKGGCSPDTAADLVGLARREGLRVDGLMAVAADAPNVMVRPQFDLLCDLAYELALPVRSIGMTGDLEAAAAAGSTMVRVGTALFGPRPGAEAGLR